MSKRVSLKQFQQDLSARLQNAAAYTALANRLGVRVGTQNWLVNLSEISEVIAPLARIRVPLAQPWLLGVSNIRGKLYSVVDLSVFSGQDAILPSTDNRLLLVHGQFSVNAALLVNQTLGLRNLAQYHPLQDNAATDMEWLSSHYQDDQAMTWKSLDIQRLAAHPVFLQAGI